MYQGTRLIRKEGWVAAGNLYTVTNTVGSVSFRQRFQMVVDDNSLSKLRHVDSLQHGMEIRLTGQNNLQLQCSPIIHI